MTEILDNTWYYTLSTTAQVFAAIMGLYSVFVIFKIEKINEFLEELRSILINIIASVETHKNINSKPKKELIDEQTLIKLSDEELLDRVRLDINMAKEIQMSMSFKSDRVAYRQMENIPLTFEHEIHRKKEVLSSFKLNLITMFCVVLFSLVVLGGSSFVDTNCLKNTLLTLNIAFVIIASFILAKSILKIVKE